MAPPSTPHSRPGTFASKLRRLKPWTTQDRPPRPILPSQSPQPDLWTPQDQLNMESPRVILGEQAAEHMQTVGNTARQRRNLTPTPELTDIPVIDYKALGRMELARHGVCEDCRSNCGQNHDCANHEEINDDPRHQMLREPLLHPPSSFPSPAPPPGPPRPPPLLKDRAYARVTPLHVPEKEKMQYPTARAEDREDQEWMTDPDSPIAITKAFPLLLSAQGSMPLEDILRRPQVSRDDYDTAGRDLNPLAYARHKAEHRGVIIKRDPVPATYAAKELGKTAKGSSMIRTGCVGGEVCQGQQGNGDWELDVLALYEDKSSSPSSSVYSDDEPPPAVPEELWPPWRPPSDVQTWI